MGPAGGRRPGLLPGARRYPGGHVVTRLPVPRPAPGAHGAAGVPEAARADEAHLRHERLDEPVGQQRPR
ncbi:hypothetical protein FRIGORI9N_10037 [Frigoribacterium sp. 9N]|nr:hypothetical protein FRIGORI9N_10037 [Frigoribacterium sp. 9N]